MSSPTTTIPCEDCIDGVNPYNPRYWAYFSELVEGYNAGTNTPAPTLCANSGDVHLGIIPNECNTYELDTPPVSATGHPYVLINKDCASGIYNTECIGENIGMPSCDIPSNTNAYGRCGGLSSRHHYWYARDWATEMARPASGTSFGDMQTYCSFLPPGNLSNGQPRTAVCPPNLWYGAYQYCSITPSLPNLSGGFTALWDSNCDSYMQQNLETAEGSPQFAKGVFLPALANWSSLFSSPGGPTTPNPQDPFIQTILKWGPTFGGSLSASLQSACANVTRDQIAQDTTGNLGKLCACYLPSNQYYLPGVIPKECDSLCSLAGTSGGIPLYEWSSSGPSAKPVPKVCEQTTCVIDQVTLDFSKTVAGNVDFTQICGSCSTAGGGGGGCTCIANGIDINASNSEIPGVNFNQDCGTFSSANGGVVPPESARAVSFWDQYKYWILGGLVALGALLAFFLIRKI
jgi:hypothetical protein